MTTSSPPNPPRRPSRRRRMFRLVWNLLAVFGLLSLIYHSCFDLTVIVSNSMSPTLQGDGRPGSDWLLADKMTYRFRNPQRWELVQFWNDDNYWVTKRVVGLPGETVAITRDKELLIDGKIVKPPAALSFLQYYPYGNLAHDKAVNCGEGYFVLGDDSKDSQDSRFDGVIAPDRIKSRAWLIVKPGARFGFVNP